MILGWFDPEHLTPPHYIHRFKQVEDLAEAFAQKGWDKSKPTLVGYWEEGKIQLLSGTHRQEAAKLAKILVPVVVWDHEVVKSAWGTEKWDEIMQIGAFKPRGLTS